MRQYKLMNAISSHQSSSICISTSCPHLNVPYDKNLSCPYYSNFVSALTVGTIMEFLYVLRGEGGHIEFSYVLRGEGATNVCLQRSGGSGIAGYMTCPPPFFRLQF